MNGQMDRIENTECHLWSSLAENASSESNYTFELPVYKKYREWRNKVSDTTRK